MKKIEIGDYVLATKWSDGKLADPWAIGFVSEIVEIYGKPRYMISHENGDLISRTAHRRAERITPFVGAELIRLSEEYDWELYHHLSMWGMKRMVSAKAYKKALGTQSTSKSV